ncbi:MAG: PIN domain-containing protein [Propionibacteriaceae bacterium]|jgi:hypothetical protein|nr:PIN domain-containing protein [Propionibacteriaceae bacterium]
MTSDQVRVFLDADVLAAPMTRTLLIVTSTKRGSRFQVCWSQAVEWEADRALRPGQTPVAEVRGRFDWGTAVLGPAATPEAMEALSDTAATDRHVLAAAKAAGIRVLVTRNVQDFGRGDLGDLGVSAVHPDLFLAHMLGEAEYRQSLAAMAAGRLRPPNTPETLHAALGSGHPRLFEAMRTVFAGVEPAASPDSPPAEVFRGNRCLVCGKPLSDPGSLAVGVGPECRRR